MTIAYVGAGALVSGTGALSAVAWPSGHVAGDLGVLFVQTANQPISAPSGWSQIGSSQGVGSPLFNGTGLQVFYKIAASGAEPSITVADSGNHTLAKILAWRGVDAASPLGATPNGTVASDAAALTFPSITTDADACVVVLGVGVCNYATSSTFLSGWSSPWLDDLTERVDQSVTYGNGGGLGIAEGLKALAGPLGSSSVTFASAANAAALLFALRPVTVPAVVANPSGVSSTSALGTGGGSGGAGASPGGVTMTGGRTAPGTVATQPVSGHSVVTTVAASIMARGAGTILASAHAALAALGTPTLTGTARAVPSGRVATSTLGTLEKRTSIAVAGVFATPRVGTATGAGTALAHPDGILSSPHVGLATPRWVAPTDLADLLPPNATSTERKLSVSSGLRLAFQIPLRDLWRPATCPENLLPWLAWGLSVDTWDETWSAAARRAICAESAMLHARKGTPWAVRTALVAMGYQNVAILEGVPFYYDGTYRHIGEVNYGSDLKPYEFDVLLGTGTMPSPEDRAEIVRRIFYYKNARSHLRHIIAYGQFYDGTFAHDGEIVYDGGTVTYE